MITSLRRRSLWWPPLLSLLLLASPSNAEPATAKSAFAKMKAALEPAKPSTRTMTFTVYSKAFNETTEIVARQARKTVPDGARSVTVVMEPQSVKGVTLLVIEEAGKPDAKYVYYPALRRSRVLTGAGAFESFLGTDFSYADIDLVDVHERSLKLLGTKPHGDTKAYELQETPTNRGYYARIVDWISTDTGLPIERDHYDVANTLWRKQVFLDVATIEGIPTPMRVRIDDVQSGDWSEFRVSALTYDVDVPDEVFEPARLREVAQNPIWSRSTR